MIDIDSMDHDRNLTGPISINSWNKGYQSFIDRKEEIDINIAKGLALDNEVEQY